MSSKRSPASREVAALIIAGGHGTRLWPESRAGRPKALFSVDGKTTLLGATIARLAPLVLPKRTFVIVSAEQRAPFRRALAGLIPRSNLIIEPRARGTALAIAYGASVIGSRLGQGLVAVIPADQYVRPPAAFRRTLKDALELAAGHPAIVVVGVTPSRAEAGYGYQRVGTAVGPGYRVARFVEKPAPALARRMVRSGRFLWNAGIFVMDRRTLGRELSAHCPELYAAMDTFASGSPAAVARQYRKLNLDSFDREVVEKSAGVLGVRARFRWHDVGTWHGLWEALGGAGRNVLAGNAIALDCTGVLARARDDHLMVLLGVDDLVTVDAGDALLIAKRSRSQDIRRISRELAQRGLRQHL